ncbi:arylsulfatase [Streptomyces sp. NPDC048527]|uniref:arylsulfatase n=1 Tax=Streptomyces sp. NPDC048527 TaxID=3365568 RepID=UPI00371274DC
MSQPTDSGRTALPLHDRRHTGPITYDARDPDTAFAPFTPVRPPEGAPDVLLVLLDDVGYGASSAFGGPVRMPTAERLAAGGLRYTRFHTTALCSPTRAALLTGRNHHAVGMGSIAEVATASPGYNSVRPNSCTPLPETLRLNGYVTAQFGKCHEVPMWETSPAGPFDRWPTGSGFQHFFGFLGGETNQYSPALFEGTTPVEPDRTPEEGYHFMEDVTDRAITWTRRRHALAPEQPMLMYFAPGATHAPHHVPKEWADRYRGEFDEGWDALRERILARQKELGTVGPDTELTERHEVIPAWEDTDPRMRPVLARQMEVYAGFLEYADHHIGRLVDTLDELGRLENTIIYYIIGDNGASAEGTLRGTFNELLTINYANAAETDEFLIENIDKFGGPESYNHYAMGWAHAMSTPYQWTKQVASHWGGTRNGTVVHWPRGISAGGSLRHQFSHVIDVAPTVLEAASLPEPMVVNGITQEPMHGTSMLYSFGDADAPERHETQYFEMLCNRGIYHKGWSAVTKHKTPGVPVPGEIGKSFDDDVWELYDGSTDWSQAHDLSAEHPQKLHELQRMFLIQAARFDVLPLDDRTGERFNPATAGRPQLVKGTSQTLYPGMVRLTENSVLNTKNRSHTVTASVTVPEDGGSGTVFAQGGKFGGWTLYLSGGRPVYCYNYVGLDRRQFRAEEPLTPGPHELRVEFAYDGGGLGKGAGVALLVDGKEVAQGRLERTHGIIFSFDESAGVGVEHGTPVSDELPLGESAFTGAIDWVRLDTTDGPEISHAERVRVAMANQ